VKDIAAIVEPAIDIRQLSRDIAREHVALQDTDRKVEVNATQGESLRKKQAEHRLEMGRLLIEAKKQVPHGGWLPFLEKLGVARTSATEWMDLAKHVETKLPADTSAGNLPSSRQVAAARREPESVGDEPDDQDVEPDETQPDPPEPFHILIDAGKLKDGIRRLLKGWPDKSRRHIPELLRDLAGEIEVEC